MKLRSTVRIPEKRGKTQRHKSQNRGFNSNWFTDWSPLFVRQRERKRERERERYSRNGKVAVFRCCMFARNNEHGLSLSLSLSVHAWSESPSGKRETIERKKPKKWRASLKHPPFFLTLFSFDLRVSICGFLYCSAWGRLVNLFISLGRCL